MKPLCWGSMINWVEWNKANEQAGAAPGKALDHYCVDCTPDYQARMITQSRCAYPSVTFTAISERRLDPVTGMLRMVDTGMVRGRLSPADEAAHQRRFEVRKKENDES